MLVNLQGVMDLAEQRKIAIGAFNCPYLESVEAIISAAEELYLPVIIQFAQAHENWIPLSTIGPIMVEAAKKSTVPVCVHLDHGETYECVQEAMDLGFTSVMYDGSTKPFEQNVKETKKAVEMAKKCGVSVEAELGSMGRRESGSGEKTGADDETKIYTDPDQAEEFVKETHIDALACSFGTTHGIYLSKPQLNFDIVKKVREKTCDIPVVMHGGSGVSTEDFHRAIEAGVRKINYFTYMDKAGGKAVSDYVKTIADDQPIFFSSIAVVAREALKEDVKTAMKTFALMD